MTQTDAVAPDTTPAPSLQYAVLDTRQSVEENRTRTLIDVQCIAPCGAKRTLDMWRWKGTGHVLCPGCSSRWMYGEAHTLVPSWTLYQMRERDHLPNPVQAYNAPISQRPQLQERAPKFVRQETNGKPAPTTQQAARVPALRQQRERVAAQAAPPPKPANGYWYIIDSKASDGPGKTFIDIVCATCETYIQRVHTARWSARRNKVIICPGCNAELRFTAIEDMASMPAPAVGAKAMQINWDTQPLRNPSLVPPLVTTGAAAERYTEAKTGEPAAPEEPAQIAAAPAEAEPVGSGVVEEAPPVTEQQLAPAAEAEPPVVSALGKAEIPIPQAEQTQNVGPSSAWSSSAVAAIAEPPIGGETVEDEGEQIRALLAPLAETIPDEMAPPAPADHVLGMIDRGVFDIAIPNGVVSDEVFAALDPESQELMRQIRDRQVSAARTRWDHFWTEAMRSYGLGEYPSPSRLRMAAAKYAELLPMREGDPREQMIAICEVLSDFALIIRGAPKKE